MTNEPSQSSMVIYNNGELELNVSVENETIWLRWTPNLGQGLTHFKGTKPTKSEARIAKNYLNEEELNILNRIVTAYIEIAEIQAMNKTPMYMNDWIARLDDFLAMTGKEILRSAGKITHEAAM